MSLCRIGAVVFRSSLGFPLGVVQHVHVLFKVCTPVLDAVVQVGSEERGVGGQNHFF